MHLVVAAIIERSDRRILIGQRRRTDSSPLKWEFPGGKVEQGEMPEEALRRELREELNAEMTNCAEISRVLHKYESRDEPLEVRFFAAAIAEKEPEALMFEQIAWVLPRELGDYDFLAANRQIIAYLATGKLKPSDFL